MSTLAENFNAICDLIVEKNKTGFDYGDPAGRDKKLIGAVKDFETQVKGLGIIPKDWTSDHSTGKGRLAFIMWMAFLPPGQEVRDGLYVSYCFGKAGNGLVTGCSISANSREKYKDIKTVPRPNPVIDVDGRRKEAKYNDGYVNPLEILSGHLNETELIAHLKDSVAKCQSLLAGRGPNARQGGSGDADSRYTLWDKFLAKWPVKKIENLKLDEYNTYGAPYQAFCNWLEFWTQDLGSIGGGSSYKFGVFRMQPGSRIIRDATRDGDGTYKWYKSYGKTAAEAYAHVHGVIVQIIESIQKGDLKKLDALKLGDAITWKIAFLYQSRENPLIVPIYARSMLSKLSGLSVHTPISQMQAKLMREKPAGMDLFAYYDELLARLPETEEDVAGGDDMEETDAAEPVKQIGELSSDDLTAFLARLEAAGLRYDPAFVRRFFAAVQAKRFVVLTGLSGSGKTQLALQFCQYVAAGRHEIVPVGADWTNNEKMLGYPDAMDKTRYVRPESGVLDLVLRAAKDPTRPYVLVLDEMNLSHVERYFADFLSAMESKGELKLHGEVGAIDGVPPKVKIPENLWVIGTMNVDETTYMFSPKVLDRAQVLEFRVKADDMKQFLSGHQADAVEALNGFFPELAKVGSEFGYRTAGEFCTFVDRAIALGGDADGAVDAAIMQKLLPKLHGSRRQLEKPLEALWKLCLKSDSTAAADTMARVEGLVDEFPYGANCRYPISAEKIARIYKNAKNNGFASYAEA